MGRRVVIQNKTNVPTCVFQIIYVIPKQCNTSDKHLINLRVPQGSVLGPVLYVLFTFDISSRTKTTVGTSADDSAILPQLA